MSQVSKHDIKDLNGAIAGDIEPQPELNTIDKIGERSGIEPIPGEPINIYDTLKERDENRLEPPTVEQP